jgi:hypothetical protein
MFARISDEDPSSVLNVASEFESFPPSEAQSVYDSKRGRDNLPRLDTDNDPLHSIWKRYSIPDGSSVKTFIIHTSRLHNIFKLSADRFKPISECMPTQVLRLAVWWLLHGRLQLISLTEQHPQIPHSEQELDLLRNAHICVAKSLWILQEGPFHLILNNHEKIVSDTKSYLHLVLSEVGSVIDFMEEHELLLKEFLEPMEPVLSSDNNCAIWIEYPSLGVDLRFLLTGNISSAVDETQFDPGLLRYMPLGSSDRILYYTTFSVNVYIFNKSSNAQQIQYPALLSVVRQIDNSQISMILASQDGKLNVSVEPEPDLKTIWDNVTWLETINSLEVKFPTEFRLQIRCKGTDFKTMKGIYHHYNNANTRFERGIDENLLFQTEIESVEWRNQTNEIHRRKLARHCKLRLFQRTVTRAEGTGPRKIHRGSRLVILTSPSTKHLSIQEWNIWPGQIINFGFVLEYKDRPNVILRMNKNDTRMLTVLTFAEREQCNLLLSHLTGFHLAESENIFVDAQLKDFSLTVPLQNQSCLFGPSQWDRVRVINSTPQHQAESIVETSTTVLSKSLRIVLDSCNSRVTDHLNLGIGELRIRRNVVASGFELHILREPQKDLTYSHSTLDMSVCDYKALEKKLQDIQTQSSIRTFGFLNLSELHQFQASITGFCVLFDGTPESFSISRRRLLLPKSKEWKSPSTRIQLLRRKESFQLVAYFEGFRYGKCMNFALKKTDSFEMVKVKNLTLIRFIDAKFALPSGDYASSEIACGFVNLDALEYPSENNNITIGFENYSGKSKGVSVPLIYTSN